MGMVAILVKWPKTNIILYDERLKLGQLDLWCLYIRFLISIKYYDFCLVIEK